MSALLSESLGELAIQYRARVNLRHRLAENTQNLFRAYLVEATRSGAKKRVACLQFMS